MSKVRVLLVDDDRDLLGVMESLLGMSGYIVTTACNKAEAIRAAGEGQVDVAVVDLVIPDGQGISLVPWLKQHCPGVQVIIFTGYPSTGTAIEAVRNQVFDYLCKPQDMGRPLLDAIGRATEEKDRANRNAVPSQNGPSPRQEGAGRSDSRDGGLHGPRAVLIGETPEIKALPERVAEVARTDMTVLIRGESGTGKSIVARMVHEMSSRGNAGSFVQINSPAVPETLMESELFGYEKGAFTGADRHKPGRLELAAGGTLFLDEIGSISLAMQAKLLEVIETKHFMRVGGHETLRLNARIVAATNSPLEEMIHRCEFRVDLLYRLNQFTIYLPPLRERRADIPVLAEHFIRYYAQKYGRPLRMLPPSAMTDLMAHEWPGNVREIEAVIARYVLSDNLTLIGEAMAIGLGKVIPPVRKSAPSLAELERSAIQAALAKARWNQRRAADILGVSYSALRRRVAKFNLKVEN